MMINSFSVLANSMANRLLAFARMHRGGLKFLGIYIQHSVQNRLQLNALIMSVALFLVVSAAHAFPPSPVMYYHPVTYANCDQSLYATVDSACLSAQCWTGSGGVPPGVSYTGSQGLKCTWSNNGYSYVTQVSGCPNNTVLDSMTGQCGCPGMLLDLPSRTCYQPPGGLNLGPYAGGPATPPSSPPAPPPPNPEGPSVVEVGGTGGGNTPDCDKPIQLDVAEPINVAIGNVFETEVDYAGVIGGGLPLRIERTYNSLSGTRGIFGNSWASNLDAQATLNVAATEIKIRLSSGQTILFTKSGATWVSSSKLPITLVSISNGYLLTTYDKRQYQFDAAGRLTALKNAQGEQQTYQYTSNQLTSVTDNLGNVLSLTYNSYGFVDSISVAGQLIQYSYNTTTTDDRYGNLISVSYPATGGGSTVSRQYLYENTQFPWVGCATGYSSKEMISIEWLNKVGNLKQV